MRLLIEWGRNRLDFETGLVDEEELDEMPFGFVSNSSLETEIAEDD